ncbi:hypothetical protein [Halopiger thermotolerans]
MTAVSSSVRNSCRSGPGSPRTAGWSADLELGVGLLDPHLEVRADVRDDLPVPDAGPKLAW